MVIDLDEAILQLYLLKIPSGHQTVRDGGVTLWLGDDPSGRQAETMLPPESIGSAGAWLMAAARRVYPDAFATRQFAPGESVIPQSDGAAPN